MQTISQALTAAVVELAVVTDQPRLEAEILLAKTLHKPRSYLHAWPDEVVTEDQQQTFQDYLKRRCDQEPVAYITGLREFWSMELLVTHDTLVPRPETELLVETVLTLYPADQAAIKVADLGTGSGAIGLAIAQERPHWEVYATDINAAALAIATKNAINLGIKNIRFFQGDWCAALPKERFDVIVSNPPYISEMEWLNYANGLKFEPRSALVSGLHGLDAIHAICSVAKEYLTANGYILMEHGFSQGEAVRHLLKNFGYQNINSICDLAGHERITMACVAHV